jgi:FAD binding domain/Berberine and berberine like
MGRRRILWLAAGTLTAACTRGASGPAITTPDGTVPASTTAVDGATPAGPPDWTALRARLTGELLLPPDDGYDRARAPFNQLLAARRPAAIARCMRPSDVQACIEVARNHKVPMAARGGGHSYAGYSTPEQGLVVDLASMAGIEVRPDGTATVGAGARLIDVYTALAGHGRALPAGSCPTVGIAGLTLGGGLGVLNRLHGLTCDRLRSAQVVLADGITVTASDGEDADLFWALRGGGGGNFGIVTAFTFDTVPAADVTVFSLRFPAGSAPGVLGGWQEWSPGTPDELWSSCVVPAGAPPGCRVGGCFVGAPGRLNGLLDDLVRGAGARPSARFVQGMDHLSAMRYFAGCSGRGDAGCRTSDPVPFIGSSRIAARPIGDPAAVVATVRGRRGIDLLFDSLGGAVGRVPVDATAFCHRDALACVQVYANAAGDPVRARREATEVQAELGRLVGSGAYINYLDPEQADWATASYGPNLPRLRELGRRYDPDRVFGFPQSVTA